MISFTEQFHRQLSFLERSCEAFDQGYKDEAIRIAVTLRVLFHDTSKSVSLITHLGGHPPKLLSTVPRKPIDPNVVAYDGITRWTGAGPTVKLGGVGVQTEEVTFDEWWYQLIYVPRQGVTITRRKLVLAAANKDGGAHVAAALTLEYEALLSMWVRHTSSAEKDLPLDDIHLIGLRQLGYEVLHSPQIEQMKLHLP